ncbi:hypothetical protein ABET49_13220 [Saccharococcus caldoxylosilyticus]|uniref:hypothetical protein n=1 Tax=Saccharococcus caldoxylosilyticus TaxID=81408 RepID=UPI002B26C4E7|nr:hypothetical protein [Parageobacillus caldoxylosilyticus]
MGSPLLRRVEVLTTEHECVAIRLITPNDNVYALCFYQKQGYQMIVQVFPNTVKQARQVKPSIPLVSSGSIPSVTNCYLRNSCKHAD